MQKRVFGSLVIAILFAACGGGAPPPGGDGGPSSCSGLTGSYNATGTTQAGSTCDASLSSLMASVSVSSADGSNFTTTLSVGGIDYACTGIVNGCRWDATCTGTGTDGSMVRGMLSWTFTNTGFSGTLSEDFSGATNCHNAFSVTGTRS